MITIHKSHGGNTTFVVGHYFINGCKVKPLSKLNTVCSCYGVKRKYRKELDEAMANNPVWGDNENWLACANYKDASVLLAVASQNRCIKTVYKTLKKMEKTGKFYDEQMDAYIKTLVKIAESGHALEELIYSEHFEVRKSVAKKGFGLDQLLLDSCASVREAVAEQKHCLDVLISDKDVHVRVAVAKHNFGLETLIEDSHFLVRKAVAGQGYGLDKLINDPSHHVVMAASEMLSRKKSA